MTTSNSFSEQDIRDAIKDIDWWHQIDLGHGITTPGRGGSTQERLDLVHLPDDLSGQSVLDIGAWDGAFSFEAERRGAARVVAVNEKHKPGLELARHVLESNVESKQLDLMDLAPERVDGPFDVVFFFGVLYHLPDPIGGLKRVYDLVASGGMMLLETDTRLNFLPFPAARLVQDERGVDNYDRNWWRPNWRAVISMCKQVGFTRAEVVTQPDTNLGMATAYAMNKIAPSLFRPLSRRLTTGTSTRCAVHAWKSSVQNGGPGIRAS